jgi:hypothetical protein
VMKQYGIPGMAVGVVAGGHEYVFTYGVASKVAGLPVTHDTLLRSVRSVKSSMPLWLRMRSWRVIFRCPTWRASIFHHCAGPPSTR